MRYCPQCGTEVKPAGAPPSPPAAGQQPFPPYQPGMPPVTTYSPSPPEFAYGTPPPAPGAIWQGIVTVTVNVLVAFLCGIALVASEPADLFEIRVGTYFIMGVVGMITLPFGIWALASNRAVGKVSAGIGLTFWAALLIAIILA